MIKTFYRILSGIKINCLVQPVLILAAFILCGSSKAAPNPTVPVAVANTIANLRGIAVTAATQDRSTIRVLGYWTENDGGGGDFYFVSGATDADNGGTIITPTTGAAYGRWYRVCPTGEMNVLWFGAKPFWNLPGQVPTDSLGAIQKAYQALPLVGGADEFGNQAHTGVLYFPQVLQVGGVPPGNAATTYYISDTLTVSFRTTVKGDGPAHSTISFLSNVAPSAATEKFVLRFSRVAGGGGSADAPDSFDMAVDNISITGWASWNSGTNKGASGIFMSGAQMSYLNNVWIEDLGLRGLVSGGATKVDRLQVFCILRGPGIEIASQSDSGAPSFQGSDVFVGFVDVDYSSMVPQFKDSSIGTPTNPSVHDGDYFPAIQLSGVNLFAVDTLSFEECPIAIKALQSQIDVAQFDAGNLYSGMESRSDTTAIKLWNSLSVHFHSTLIGHYATQVYNFVAAGYDTGATERSYGVNTAANWSKGVTSFHIQNQIKYTTVNGEFIEGYGIGTALKVMAKGVDSTGKNTLTDKEGDYIAEFFQGTPATLESSLAYSGGTASLADGIRMFGVKKNGDLVGQNNSRVPLATSGASTTLVQPGTYWTVSVPALAAGTESSVSITMPSGAPALRAGDVVQAGLALSGVTSGVTGGLALPTGVVLMDSTVNSSNTVSMRFRNVGSSASSARNVVYKMTVLSDQR